MNNRFEIRGDKVAIFLDRKDGSVLETIISIEHLEKVQEFPYKWNAQWNRYTKSFYVQGNLPKNGKKHKTVRMHRFITNCPDGQQVDHINRDTLDNTISNLRNITKSENAQNVNLRIDNKSGFRGIYWDKLSGKWRAQININKKRKSLGCFSDINEAAKSVHLAMVKFYPGYIY